jgi:hypothetical protein
LQEAVKISLCQKSSYIVRIIVVGDGAVGIEVIWSKGDSRELLAIRLSSASTGTRQRTSRAGHVVEHNVSVDPDVGGIATTDHVSQSGFVARSGHKFIRDGLVTLPPGANSNNGIFSRRRDL